ncbi:MAG TPA: FadR family transcriptional regulator [Thermoanaerobacterales bacterium]|jgi:GntR family transcriptional repressor for pyruvate dehydrogenase complex|nr:FadR family transcriptional regulator [Thermoanaerobacterales bacterium]
MIFRKVKNVRLYETIIDQIMDMVNKGDILPGDKFPSERILMERLGVSRAVLREAFRVLEYRGLVESKPGGGRYLRKTGELSLLKVTTSDLERDALLDVVEAREIVEVEVVRLAAKRADEKELKQLIEIDEKYHGFDATLEEYHKKDMDLAFHLKLAEMSHNFMLKEMVSFMLTLTTELREKSILDFEDWLNLCKEHSCIVKAIKERDEDQASERMKLHLNRLRMYLLKK